MKAFLYTYAPLFSLFLFILTSIFWLKYKSRHNNISSKILLFLILFLFIFHALLYNTDAEDAYISYRYADNFIKGNGIVFNDFEKVEGYSNFLWIITLSLVHIVTKIELPLSGRILSFVFSLLTLLSSYFVIFKLTSQRQSGLYTLLMIASSGIFACYATSGLEGSLFSFLILMNVLFLLKGKWFLSGVVIALATMTRPEGCLLIFPNIAYILFLKRKFSVKEKIRLFSVIALGTSLLIIPWTIWRIEYYGYFIPNTIATKSGMNIRKQLVDGYEYLNGFLTVTAPLLLLFFFKAINILFNKRFRIWIFQPYNIILFSIIVCYSVFYVLIGGDWMPGWRFFAPIIPVLAILTTHFWFAFPSKKYSANELYLAPALFLICSYFTLLNTFTNTNMLVAVQSWKTSVKQLTILGNWFNQSLSSNIVVASYPNGAFSYYNKLYTIDVFGLTDEHIARLGKRHRYGTSGHIAYDYEYIINRKPDIIAFMQGIGFTNSPVTWEAIDSIASKEYSNVTFLYNKPITESNKYVSFYILKSKKEFIIENLLKGRSDFSLLTEN